MVGVTLFPVTKALRIAFDAISLLAAALLPFLLEFCLRSSRDPLLVVPRGDRLLTLAIAVAMALVAGLLTARRPDARGGRAALALSGLWIVSAAAHRIAGAEGSLGGALLALLLGGVVAGASLLALQLLDPRARLRALALAVTLCLLPITAWLLRTPSAPTGPDRKRPDVMLIVLDTARADHLSVHGHHRPTTPALERLAKRAQVFDRAWSPAPWTPSAHASLLTGLLPAEHGCEGGPFDVAGPVLPELLQRAGYATLAVVNNPILPSRKGWSRGFDDYLQIWDPPAYSVSYLRWLGLRRREGWRFLGDTETSLAWLRRWWHREREKPRFVMLNLLDAHSPYGRGDRQSEMFLDERTREAAELPGASEEYDAGLARAEGAALERITALYDADVWLADHLLGEFFTWLGDRQREQTLIVVTADHGERLGERGLLGHQLGLDESLLRVPLLLHHPTRLPPGRIDAPVQTHQLFATLLELVGIEPPPGRAPGLDRPASVIVGQMQHQGWYLEGLKRRNPVFDPSPFAGNWSSVSDGVWKLVGSTTGVRRLHHLPGDATEERDLAAEHPEELDRLAPWLEALPAFASETGGLEVPEETRDLLRGLGYLDDADGS